MRRLLDILGLVHQEAMNAYWAMHCHCEGKYGPECSEPPGCSFARQCHLEVTIDNAIQNLETSEETKGEPGAALGRPKIVCLCGSSRFVDIMAVCGWLIERDELAIAMGLHLIPTWYTSPSGELPQDHLAEHEGCAQEMDALHLRKIDLADEIFVVDYKGYVGPSTANEIAHAQARGKVVRRYSLDPIGRRVDDIVRIALQKEDPPANEERKEK